MEVLQVRREGSKAVHFTKEPLLLNQEVTQVVNWERRFDHMQQHSGININIQDTVEQSICFHNF